MVSKLKIDYLLVPYPAFLDAFERKFFCCLCSLLLVLAIYLFMSIVLDFTLCIYIKFGLILMRLRYDKKGPLMLGSMNEYPHAKNIDRERFRL